MHREVNRISSDRPGAQAAPSRAERRALSWLVLVMLPVLGAGCDAWDGARQAARPEVRLVFEQPELVSETGAPASKSMRLFETAASYTVILQVQSTSGRDFSPDPTTVGDSEQETRFVLNLPPDQDYAFSVRYQSGSRLVAEGGALQRVSDDTRVVEVPIIPLSSDVATVGFLPGRSEVGVDETGTVPVRMKLYANGTSVAGLVCVIDVEGVDSSELEFDGADVSVPENGQLGLAWAWPGSISTDTDLGTLRVPRAEAGTIRLRVVSGNVRSVDNDGAIVPLQAVGAQLEIRP